MTCHLTCPVTDFINKRLTGASEFVPVRFQGWPELKEAFISGYLLLEIEALAKETGVLKGNVTFADYTDASFVPPDNSIQPYAWDYKKNTK